MRAAFVAPEAVVDGGAGRGVQQVAGQAQPLEARVYVEPGDAAECLGGQAGGAEQAVQPQAADERDVTGDLAAGSGDPGAGGKSSG